MFLSKEGGLDMIRKSAILVLALVLCVMAVPTMAETAEVVQLDALFIKHALTREFSEMEWLRQAEEIAGVDITWQEISADWEQIKTTMFASGDIPDLLFVATADSDYATFQGLFEDMAPMITEENTPNLWAFYEAHPEAKNLATMLDGSIYGLSSYQRFWPAVATSMYINQTWLDNLGLAMPTTWDELKAVLVAFRDGDPNGNGIADEFPMDFLGYSPSGGQWGQYHVAMMLNQTGIQTTNFWQMGYFAEDGVVKSAYVDERYKELVLFVRDLYSEGLINPETWTNDYSTYQSVTRAGGDVATVGVTWGWEATDRFGLVLAPQYTALAPLKVSADYPADPTVEYDFVALNIYKNRIALSAQSENKEAAMRFVDTLYDPEFGLQVLWGGMNDMDKGTRKNEDGSYTVLPPADEEMDWGTWKWTMTWADNGNAYIADDMVINLGDDMVDTLAQRAIYDAYIAKIDLVEDLYYEPYMKFTNEEMSTMAMNQANIDQIALPNFVAWVTGSQDIEAEWDGYVSMLNDMMGLTQNLAIKQAAYDTWKAAQ
jgi:putative aldouronate transport system substrate-binding protein